MRKNRDLAKAYFGVFKELKLKDNKPLTYRGAEVDRLLGISKSSRYAWQDPKSQQYDPSWPLPIKLASRSTGYLVSEVEAWLASRPRSRTITCGAETGPVKHQISPEKSH